MGCARIRRGCGGRHGAAANTPRTRRPPPRARRRDTQSPEAVHVSGTVLSVSTDGHLLEVRDAPLL